MSQRAGPTDKSLVRSASVRNIFVGFFLLFSVVGFGLMSMVLTNRIDAVLADKITGELVPNLQVSMEGIGKEQKTILQGQKQASLQRAEKAFAREKTAVVE